VEGAFPLLLQQDSFASPFALAARVAAKGWGSRTTSLDTVHGAHAAATAETKTEDHPRDAECAGKN